MPDAASRPHASATAEAEAAALDTHPALAHAMAHRAVAHNLLSAEVTPRAQA